MADAAGRGVRRCPRCGAEGYVIDSRLNAAGEVTGMRFNVDKYFSGNGWYSMMEPEELAFHDATGRKIYSVGRTVRWIGNCRRRVYPRVVIDMDGKITAEVIWRYKNESANVKLQDIQGGLDDLLGFLSSCYDFGYLIPDGGDGDG